MSIVTSFFHAMIAAPAIPLTVALLVIIVYTFYLDHKIVVLTRGKSGSSLEDVIKECILSVQEIEKRNEFISKHALMLEDKVSHSIRNAQTIRYKAYEVNGSNQSFSVALVNEKGNGVILSSLHSHDRMSTFAKPVENYASTYELTDEETYVLEEAKSAHKIGIKD
jgi:hypothetical protein